MPQSQGENQAKSGDASCQRTRREMEERRSAARPLTRTRQVCHVLLAHLPIQGVPRVPRDRRAPLIEFESSAVNFPGLVCDRRARASKISSPECNTYVTATVQASLQRPTPSVYSKPPEMDVKLPCSLLQQFFGDIVWVTGLVWQPECLGDRENAQLRKANKQRASETYKFGAGCDHHSEAGVESRTP